MQRGKAAGGRAGRGSHSRQTEDWRCPGGDPPVGNHRLSSALCVREDGCGVRTAFSTGMPVSSGKYVRVCESVGLIRRSGRRRSCSRFGDRGHAALGWRFRRGGCRGNSQGASRSGDGPSDSGAVRARWVPVFWLAVHHLCRVPGDMPGSSTRLSRDLPDATCVNNQRHASWKRRLDKLYRARPLDLAEWDTPTSASTSNS